MRKTYCDRCGTECRNYHATLNMTEEHTTSGGEQVEEAYMRVYKDLCKTCKESLQEWFGSDLGMLGEEALAQLKQQRVAEYAAEVMQPMPAVGTAHP